MKAIKIRYLVAKYLACCAIVVFIVAVLLSYFNIIGEIKTSFKIMVLLIVLVYHFMWKIYTKAKDSEA